MTLSKDVATGALQISGKLEIEAAEQLRDALLDHLLHAPAVELDLGSVSSFDTATLQVLLATRQAAEASSKCFRILAASPAIRETVSALGLSRALDIERNEPLAA